jgi:hypothetical protein
VIEVHPPTEPMHGWRDFLLHLLTITIGLLIALSLEGCVEWQHHRHLVHDAEASLGREIASNARDMAANLEGVRNEQRLLSQDVAVLKKIIANPKVQNHDSMSIRFNIRGFNDVSWKTAQSTGAFGYMPYSQAQEYSDIYDQQHEIDDAEHLAVRDTVVSVAPFLNAKDDDPNPSAAEAAAIKSHIEILQGQLSLVENLMVGLNDEYKKFLAAHPE